MNALPAGQYAAAALLALCAMAAAPHTDVDVQLATVNEQLASEADNYSLYLRRGELRRHEQDWRGAEADFAHADRLASGAVRHRLKLYRGRLFQEAGHSERAIAELDGFIAQHPQHVVALRVRALAYAQLGAFTEAIADYGRLIALDPARSPELWLERARLLVRAGRTEAALASIDDATARMGPLVTFIEFALATLIERNDHAAALARIDNDLPPSLAATPLWLWRRGTILQQLGRADDAAIMFERARAEISILPPHRQETVAMRDLLHHLKVNARGKRPAAQTAGKSR